MKIGIVGLGSFGRHLVRALADLGVEVLAVDNREECVASVKDDASFCAVLDVTNRDALARLPIEEMDTVVVTIGEDFRSAMLATAHLLRMKPKRLICRAASDEHAQLLRALGIDEVVEPEAVAARQVAGSLVVKGGKGSYGLAQGFSILEVTVPERLVGKRLVELDLRRKYELNLVTVKRREKDAPDVPFKVLGVPPPDFAFSTGDVLVLFGAETRLRKFLEG